LITLARSRRTPLIRAIPGLSRNAPVSHVTDKYERDGVGIWSGDALGFYAAWAKPVVIISDGPYGLAGFPGDPPKPELLANWYEPHIAQWSRHATPMTTLWFWNTELGWANVHPLLVQNGWEYRNCHVWNKGIAHIAGNSNSKTLRKFPVITEVCLQYTKKATFEVAGEQLDMQQWLRHEWERSGLPWNKTNEACGVKNAATRKYFTKDHLWYYPPPEAFERMVHYANKHGNKVGGPYFSLDGRKPVSAESWARLRAKFYCFNGVTNIWDEPAVRGIERLKNQNKCVHTNQKPLRLVELCIKASSDEGDVVWEPFGGLCSAAVASHKLRRRCFAAEIIPEYFRIAVKRLENYDVF